MMLEPAICQFRLISKLGRGMGGGGKYFNIVDLCGILPYIKGCVHTCVVELYTTVSHLHFYTTIRMPGSKYRL